MYRGTLASADFKALMEAFVKSQQTIESMKKDEYAFKRKLVGGAAVVAIASIFGGAYAISRPRRIAHTAAA